MQRLINVRCRSTLLIHAPCTKEKSFHSSEWRKSTIWQHNRPSCKCAHRHKKVTGTLEHPVSKDEWVKLIFRHAFCVLNTLTRDIRAAPATFIPHHGTQGNSLTPIPAFCFQAIVTSKFSFRLLLLVISSNALKRLLESSSHSFLCLLCSVTSYL